MLRFSMACFHRMRLYRHFATVNSHTTTQPLSACIPQSVQQQTARPAPFMLHSSLLSARHLSSMDGSTRCTPEQTWEGAHDILSSLIAFKSRADAGGWRDAFENMPVYLERIGMTQEQLNKLHVIHVTGTKGKGSTCAMVESILRQCGYRTGLYTSPHLVDIRERIRIDGQLVSKEVFLKHFWECYNQFKSKATDEVGVPGYFRFITLLALKIFLEAKVDVVILEVGIGGRLDATNIVPHPVVCAVASLGMDHMDMLGDTIGKIAREKAGIFKAGHPAITVPQPEEGMVVLEEVAASKGCPLRTPPSLDSFRTADGKHVTVALGGEHMRLNASLAVQLAATWEELSPVAQRLGHAAAAHSRLQKLAQGVLPAEYVQGLECVRWPGRSQVVHVPEFSATINDAQVTSSRLTFYLDGAHTPESMATCAQWFATSTTSAGMEPQNNVKNILVFNCMKEREPSALLPALGANLATSGCQIHAALFVPPDSTYGMVAPSNSSSATPAMQSGHATPVPADPAAHAALPTHTAATMESMHKSNQMENWFDGSSKPSLQQTAADRATSLEAGSHVPGSSSTSHSNSSHGATTIRLNGDSAVPQNRTRDLSWQLRCRAVWQQQCEGVMAKDGFDLGHAVGLEQGTAVVASLGQLSAVLHEYARQNPNTHVRVLVTGSLYLVGDTLRMLGCLPS